MVETVLNCVYCERPLTESQQNLCEACLKANAYAAKIRSAVIGEEIMTCSKCGERLSDEAGYCNDEIAEGERECCKCCGECKDED